MIDRTQEEIMRDWQGDMEQPLVSVRCITYNHEPYIAQALDGFLMQKTNFPFEVIVHDDASTDRTADIVREYEKKHPKIIRAIYQTENQYSKRDGSIGRIMNAACRGRYIAICEGDDYWIDGNKLQMQVDFLEANPEYGMCYTQARVYNQSRGRFGRRRVGGGFSGFGDLLLNGNRVPTLTAMYKMDLLERYWQEIRPHDKGWLMGDYPMWLYIAHESRVGFVAKATAVYRMLEESASHSRDMDRMLAFSRSAHEIRKFYGARYGVEVGEWDESETLFYLYLGRLKEGFTLADRRRLVGCYKAMGRRRARDWVRYVFVRSVVLFLLYQLLFC